MGQSVGRLICNIACVFEIVPTFLGLEEVADIADSPPEGVISSLLGLSQERLELGEGLLDRVEIGRVFRQEQGPSAALGQCRAVRGLLWTFSLSARTKFVAE